MPLSTFSSTSHNKNPSSCPKTAIIVFVPTWSSVPSYAIHKLISDLQEGYGHCALQDCDRERQYAWIEGVNVEEMN